MNMFYATDIRGELIVLDEEESRHAVQVLRRRVGEELIVVDGRGGLYHCTIVDTGKRRCTARIDRAEEGYGRRPFRLHMAVAPTKNLNRFEWFLEKATEIGVEAITPLWCAHSERRHLRTDRLEKILLAAMKQSLKACLPELREPESFADFASRGPAGETRLIAHLGPGTKGHLWRNYQPGCDVTILIGPEGDFSEEELALAREHGFVAVSLGGSRLRTETAAVAACQMIALANELREE